MKTGVLFILLFPFILQVHAQPVYNHKALTVQLAPLMMVDPIPRIRAGMEYTSGPWRLSLTYGIGHSFFNESKLTNRIYDRDYSLQEFRPEVKYSLFTMPEVMVIFGAVEFFHVRTRATLNEDHYTHAESGMEIFFDEARFERYKTGAHIKTGIIVLAGRWLEVELYGGLGGAFRKIQYRNVIHPVENPDYFEEWIPQAYRNEGESFYLNPTLGMKIGFVLWHKSSGKD